MCFIYTRRIFICILIENIFLIINHFTRSYLERVGDEQINRKNSKEKRNTISRVGATKIVSELKRRKKKTKYKIQREKKITRAGAPKIQKEENQDNIFHNDATSRLAHKAQE